MCAVIWAAAAFSASGKAEKTQFSGQERARADYSDVSNWAYFALDAEKPVDVFMLCPTVDVRNEFNMALDDEKTKASFVGALNMEKGIYEDSVRLFAPFYRQAAMKVYGLDVDEREKHLEIAYRDVSDAFSWYLENVNQGRPMILAGFSQGADMCYRLLKEYFGDRALYSRLVAVYAIGWPCTRELVEQYPFICPAQGETDTGVVISFDCEAPEVTDTFIYPAGQQAYSINPLNWRIDAVCADRTENPGACFTNYSGEIEREEKGLCGCYLDTVRGVLKVTDLDAADYPLEVPGLPEGAWHVYDYMFFYRALQNNVYLRTESYLKQSNYLEALDPAA
ncbi:MAG: DUF3089 domain-containing protein [Clostridiales bacterium]|nr:DUF3089 domain-containing protein [Clostridiales bacterium]